MRCGDQQRLQVCDTTVSNSRLTLAVRMSESGGPLMPGLGEGGTSSDVDEVRGQEPPGTAPGFHRRSGGHMPCTRVIRMVLLTHVVSWRAAVWLGWQAAWWTC
jgi:hypothetical protein